MKQKGGDRFSGVYHVPEHNPKVRAVRKHAAKRFQERFGEELDGKLLDEIIRDIQYGRAKFIGKQSNKISIFEVQKKNKQIRVVYDKKYNTPVTFLTMDMNPYVMER